MLGAVLVGLSACGIWIGVHAGLAQVLYHSAKHGPNSGDVDRVLSLCCQAYDLYPWNYYFAIYAAEAAYYRAGEPGGARWRDRMESARLWCDRGLKLNPWKSQLRRLESRFLWEESPAKAISYWSAYTDWNYWEPYNHQVLAEMYSKAGDFGHAHREIALISSFPEADIARQTVEKERRTWDAMLRGDASGWGE